MKNLILFFLTLSVITGELSAQTTRATDGTRADVAAKIALSAASGDTITIPAGSFTWTSGVSTSKAIKFQGAGSGRVVACSDTSITVGTGTKVFTLKVETVSTLASLRSAITNGATMRIWRNGGNHAGGVYNGTLSWMEGTVTSLVGNTLTMNISSVNGSGTTQGNWLVMSTAQTTLIMNFNNSSMFNLTESTVAGLEVTGIRFQHDVGLSAIVDTTADFIVLNSTASGYPVLIHDNDFIIFTYGNPIHGFTSKGVVWNCSFTALPFVSGPLAFHMVNTGYTTSWTTASTFGSNDTTGKGNFYVEDCDFHGWTNSNDFDENLRSVVRYSLYDSAGWGSHGADSSNYGMRHFEVYNCEFRRTDFSDGQTMNVGWAFLIRGGTGVITDNVVSAYGGADYGSGPKVNLALWNLQLNGGPNPLWGKNIAGIQYPCPRQVGMGRVTGSGTDGTGRSTDSFSYVGDVEPLYIWGNTGTALVPTLAPYSAPQAGEDVIADYVQSGRDYFFGTAKPSYTKYTYPHPLRTAATASAFTSSILGKIKLSGKATIK